MFLAWEEARLVAPKCPAFAEKNHATEWHIGRFSIYVGITNYMFSA